MTIAKPQSPLSATTSPYILRRLNIFNWGPFGNRHCADIDARGTAIIGPTGSGKTTLVDALMTLLTVQPKYNLASTGGHESDRDLMSYLRGVSGAGNNSGDNSHIARPGKTVTGISAEFSDGENTLQIGALFWVDGAGFASSDRKDLWIMTERNDQSLDQWLTLHNEGGARALKQYARDLPKLQVFDTKKAYLAQLRRFFEVGENAFTLLNRAAGLKQLNSIDEIFRELVLDDCSAFERASEVAKEFDDLAAIRNELDIARRQQQSLLPIEQTHKDFLDTEQRQTEQQHLLQILPRWYAQVSYRRWGEKAALIGKDIDAQTQRIQLAESEEARLQSKADALKEIYLQLGGNTIEQLEMQIVTQHKLTEERRRHAEEYQRLTQALGRPTSLTATELDANKHWADQQTRQLNIDIESRQNDVYTCGALHSQHQQKARELSEEIAKIEARPGSNIPSQFQDFRADLAVALGLDDQHLPFVAELIEVKSEQANWRGAIERAIGGNRLRILVPAAHLKAALHWVNQRNNRLHVRLLDAATNGKPALFLDDGFARKLNFKPHPLLPALKALLESIDRHCVATPETLHATHNAMTEQGLMSGTQGRFEKQDQHGLDKGLLTGFDNKDRLENLRGERRDAETHLHQSKSALQTSIKSLEKCQQQHALLTQVAHLQFEWINLPEAEAILIQLRERLHTLNDPQSTAGKARRDYERLATELNHSRSQLILLNTERGSMEQQGKEAFRHQQLAHLRTGEPLNQAQLLLVNVLPLLDSLPLDALDQSERQEREKAEKNRDRLNTKLNELSRNIVRQMGQAKTVDTGALSETGTQLQDVPAYLQRLKVLNEEALPEKLHRFLAYLNQSSDQGVTQLLADIDNEVSIIEERINDLNSTLLRVDFQQDRYLQLIPQRVIHESLRKLEGAQKHLRFAALKDDQGESHYRALENVVTLLRDAAESKRTVGARALLDPRYRLQFAVSVLDRYTGDVIEIRTGSQGGSGGEKEIIASYILTASLSYALCPKGAVRPLFGTIVLDEAFSKSSQAVAGRIISALREFGLHPLFITPNKEMRLLREHTHSAILVHRKGLQSTLTSLSWEALETHAQRKLHTPNEIA